MLNDAAATAFRAEKGSLDSCGAAGLVGVSMKMSEGIIELVLVSEFFYGDVSNFEKVTPGWVWLCEWIQRRHLRLILRTGRSLPSLLPSNTFSPS